MNPELDSGPGEGSLRLDKWLWFARFFKSRSLATKCCNDGKLRVDGQKVSKANTPVRPGQVLTFVKDSAVRVIRIEALGVRRGPAPEARTLYADLSPAPSRAPVPPGQRSRGAGRPTKRDRRQLDRLRN